MGLCRSHELELLEIIAEIRSHFETHFDRGWLALLIDDTPLASNALQEIRQLLSVTTLYPEDYPTVSYGARQLERFATDLRRCLLPVIRDRLGVSGFSGSRQRLTQGERIQRSFLCYTFPHNLEHLEELAARLRETVEAAAGIPLDEHAATPA